MNTLPQTAGYAQAGYGNPSVAPPPPNQLSLNEKLQTLAGHARNMSMMAFEIGSRLGALQPVPTAGAAPKADLSHANSLINELDGALTQLNEDLNRILSFVG